MLFLVRSAFCITAIVLALPEAAHVSAPADDAGRIAVAALRAICQAESDRCLALAKGATGLVVDAASIKPAAITHRTSRETLAPAATLHHASAGPPVPARGQTGDPLAPPGWPL